MGSTFVHWNTQCSDSLLGGKSTTACWAFVGGWEGKKMQRKKKTQTMSFDDADKALKRWTNSESVGDADKANDDGGCSTLV